MPRRTFAEIKEQYEKAKRRQDSREAQRKAAPKVYTPRPDSTELIYRSLLLNNEFWKVKVADPTLTMLTSADLGLYDEMPTPPQNVTFNIPRSVYGRGGIKPTLISWYFGDNTPSTVVTEWGSRWVKFYDVDRGQSHRSAAFSRRSDNFGTAALITAFNGLFNPNDGTKRALLGERGKATIKFEVRQISHSGG